MKISGFKRVISIILTVVTVFMTMPAAIFSVDAQSDTGEGGFAAPTPSDIISEFGSDALLYYNNFSGTSQGGGKLNLGGSSVVGGEALNLVHDASSGNVHTAFWPFGENWNTGAFSNYSGESFVIAMDVKIPSNGLNHAGAIWTANSRDVNGGAFFSPVLYDSDGTLYLGHNGTNTIETHEASFSSSSGLTSANKVGGVIGSLSTTDYTNIAVVMKPVANTYKVFIDGVAVTDDIRMFSDSKLSLIAVTSYADGWVPRQIFVDYVKSGNGTAYMVVDNLTAYVGDDYIGSTSGGSSSGSTSQGGSIAPTLSNLINAFGSSAVLYYNDFGGISSGGGKLNLGGSSAISEEALSLVHDASSGNIHTAFWPFGENWNTGYASGYSGESFVIAMDVKIPEGGLNHAGAIWTANSRDVNGGAFFSPVLYDSDGTLYLGHNGTNTIETHEASFSSASGLTAANKVGGVIGFLSTTEYTNIAVVMKPVANTYKVFIDGVAVTDDIRMFSDSKLSLIAVTSYADGWVPRQIFVDYVKSGNGTAYMVVDNLIAYVGDEYYTDVHKWDSGVITAEPTCTQTGVKTYTCEECGLTKTELLSALGHSFGSWTDDLQGNHTRECVCGLTETAVHVWNSGVVSVEPTCNSAGVRKYTCTVCRTVKTESISASSEYHSWGEGAVTTEPTCKADGVKTYTCAHCGDTKTESLPQLTEHTWDSGTVTVTPTCTTDGVKLYTCTTCSATYTENMGKHNFSAWAKYSDTQHTRSCPTCGETEYAEHTWDSGVAITPATYVSGGESLYTCTGCGATKTEATARLSDGKFGTVTYGFDTETKTLYIYGTGLMWSTPWKSFKDEIKHVVIEKGITSIGDWAFSACSSLESITLPVGITSIGKSAFHDCRLLTSISLPASLTSIGASAFNDCVSLKAVTIPVNVSSIGYSAFKGCASLDAVTIPSGVTEVGAYTFYGCKKLRWVSIPSSVTSIGYAAFYGCRFLTEVSIPANVTTLGAYAFYGCEILESITVPSLVAYVGSNTFEGCANLKTVSILCSITKIPDSMFSGCERLLEVNIPTSVTGIGDYAFLNCSMMKSIDIPSSVTEIGHSAFAGCASLKSVAFPSGLTKIGYAAFSDCKAVTSITVPASVSSIGSGAFGGCESLQTITVDSANNYYKAENGVLYTKDGATLIQYALGKTDKSFTVPSGVTLIDNSAFRGGVRLTSVTVSSSVKTIGYAAFSGCVNLSSVSISGSVTKIESEAFSDCSSLASVSIPAGVITIGSSVFARCTALTNISVNSSNSRYKSVNGSLYSKDGKALIQYAIGKTDTAFAVPSDVKDISHSAFSDCYSIRRVTLPESLETINQAAFRNCINLINITIPSSVTSISAYAFYNCKALTDAAIPNELKSVGAYAFYNCKDLGTVVIPEGVKDIGAGAFAGCSSLTDINVDSANTRFTSVDGSLYTADGKTLVQYASGKKATEFEIPSGVTAIGAHAFDGSTHLASVSIPSAVTEIPDYAFYGCSTLKSVALPEGTLLIGDSAFAGCISLFFEEIPTGVVFIGEEAFRGCAMITEVNISESVKFIGGGAFSYCTSLENISVSSSNTVYKAVSGSLYSKDGSTLVQYALGKTDTSFAIPSGVTEIGKGAISGAAALTAITVPSSVTHIGSTAFAGCDKLSAITVDGANTEYKSVSGDLYTADGKTLVQYAIGKTDASFTVPSEVERIEDYAFNGAANLETVTIPDSVVSIGDVAFARMTELGEISVGENNIAYKSVSGDLYTKDGKTLIQYAIGKEDTSFDVPSDVRIISAHAFRGNASLENITVPATVVSIGYNAFGMCSELQTVTVSESNTAYKSVDGSLYTKNGRTLVRYAIGSANSAAVLPDGVTRIEDFAFYQNASVTGVTLPSSVAHIGNGAFLGCSSLSSITVNEANQAYKSVDGNLYTKDGKVLVQYAIGKADASLVIPSDVKYVENGALAFAGNLTAVTVPASVESVGYAAFYECGVDTVNYGGSITEFNQIKTMAYNTAFTESSVTYGECETHVWNDGEVLVPPTCQSEGQIKYTCTECLRTKTETLEKGGHDFENCVKYDETKHYGTCVCGESGYENHVWDSGVVVTQPTYAAVGIIEYTCTDCDATKTGEIDRLYTGMCGTNVKYGFDTTTGTLYIFGTGAITSTPWTKSSITAVVISEGVTTIKSNAFSFASKLKTATIPVSVTTVENAAFNQCGLTTVYYNGKPSEWANVSIGSSNAKLNNATVIYGDCDEHTWNDGEITTEPSCGVDGVKTYTCSVCNRTKEEYITSDEHTWDSGAVTTEPSCTAFGVRTYTCSVCGATMTETIEATGHSWDGGVVTTEPSCTEEGVKTYTCSGCGDTRTESVDATGHSFGAFTKYDDAQHVKACACGEKIYESHDWNDGEVTTEPTYTEDGVKTYTCSVCSGTKTEKIPAKEHVFGDYTKYDDEQHVKECECGEKIYENHTWDAGVETKAPTCTESGLRTYTCSICNGTKTEVIAATGHSFGAFTKYDDAQHVKECACGEKVYESHAWNSGEVTTEPTCTESGVRTYTCSTCTATKTEGIEATGHSFGAFTKYDDAQHVKECACGEKVYGNHEWNDGEVTVPPTVNAEGQKAYTCTVCTASKTEPIEKLPFVLGDANGDGKLTQIDAFYIARHCASWEGYEAENINYAACDLNSDGKVTQLDAFILSRHLANWEGYENLPYGVLTYEAYLAMSSEEKLEYYNSFETSTEFFEWYNSAKAAYDAKKEDLIIDGDINIDL